MCTGCGLWIEGGPAGCRRLFDHILARDFSDVSYFRVHRLLVDNGYEGPPPAFGTRWEELFRRLRSVAEHRRRHGSGERGPKLVARTSPR